VITKAHIFYSQKKAQTIVEKRETKNNEVDEKI